MKRREGTGWIARKDGEREAEREGERDGERERRGRIVRGALWAIETLTAGRTRGLTRDRSLRCPGVSGRVRGRGTHRGYTDNRHRDRHRVRVRVSPSTLSWSCGKEE